MGNITYKEAMQLVKLDDYANIAKDYIKLINLAIDTRWQNIVDEYKDCKEEVDVEDLRYEDILMLRLFKYRMELMTITCLCETWEQDIYNFLKEEGVITSRNNEYNQIKNIFNNNFPSQQIENYPRLDEMRKLVNSIKHGNGSSFDNLRSLLGDDILADSNHGIDDGSGNVRYIKQRRYDDNTLTSITLDVSGKIELYYNEIVKFWNDVFNELRSRNRNVR